MSSRAVSASCGGECVRVEEERGRTSGGSRCLSQQRRGLRAASVCLRAHAWGERAGRRGESRESTLAEPEPHADRREAGLLQVLRRGAGSERRDAPQRAGPGRNLTLPAPREGMWGGQQGQEWGPRK